MTARRSTPTRSVLFDLADTENMTHLRHLGQVHRRAGKAQREADGYPSAGQRARPWPRPASPLVPESFDYVYDNIKQDLLPVLDLRRHRHRVLLRARQPAAAGVSRRDPVPRLGHEGRGVRRRGQAGRAAKKGELVCSAPVPVDADRVLERPGRQKVSRRLFRDAFPASGAMATTWSSPSAAAR